MDTTYDSTNLSLIINRTIRDGGGDGDSGDDESDMHSKFNLTLEEFLLYRIGPKQLPLNIIVPLTIVYLLIFMTGVIGNFVVCVVIIRNSTMHTATNYYLFSLAISDLTLLLLGLPNDLSVFWHQYPYPLGTFLCKGRALLSETASNVSVLTIVAFSMERYLAICHPLHLYTMSGLQRAIRIIAILWIVSLLCAVPFALFTKVNYLDYPPGSGQLAMESAFCAMLDTPQWPIGEMSTVLFFVLPMIIIMVLYARMGLKIRKRTQGSLSNGSVHGESRHSQSRKTIIRMLAAVVIAFFVCWAPFHTQRLLYIYFRESEHFSTINEWMFYITGILYYVSSTVNPILYNVMSNRYRIAFRETLCGGRGRAYSNGFQREQSSFRETMIGSTYETTHLVRVRSVIGTRNHLSPKYTTKRLVTTKNCSNNIVQWQDEKDLLNKNNEVVAPSTTTSSNVVVILTTPTVNGKTKCYTTTNNTHNNFDCPEENKHQIESDLDGESCI